MYEDIKEKLTAGNINGVRDLVEKYLGEGKTPKDILDNGLIAGMDVIGDRFKKSEVFIPEVMIAAKAMHAGLDILQPRLAEAGARPVGRVVIGTIKGDLHDIGKNIVGMMFKGAGFSVTDLGIDVAPVKFLDAAQKSGADIVAVSSLLTTSMPFMGDVVKSFKAGGLDSVKVMVGGAPVTQGFADSIGADGYADDASSAVDKAREMLGIRV
ncbi:MAG: corrinoid protein [Candidatus Omnitrophota bacterium]